MDLPNVHGGKITWKSLLQKFFWGVRAVAIPEKLRKLALLHVPPQEIYLSKDILFANYSLFCHGFLMQLIICAEGPIQDLPERFQLC